MRRKSRDDYDSPWKEALCRFLREFMQLLFPQLHGAIDWTKDVEFLDKELQKIAHGAKLGRNHADMLVKVGLKSGKPLRILIHIEVQGNRDANFAERMYVYNYRSYDKHRIQVVSLAVLADDSRLWRPRKFEYSLFGCEVRLKFPIVKLNDFRTPERMAKLVHSKNPFALFIMAHLKTQETKGQYNLRLDSKLDFLRKLLRKGVALERIREMFRFVDWIMPLPHNTQEAFLARAWELEEEYKMPFIDCFEKRGIEKGIEKGIDVGRIQAYRESIVAILRDRYHSVPNEIEIKIDAMTDLELLKSLHLSAARAGSLREFTSRLSAGN